MNQDQFSPSTYAAATSKAQKAIDEAVSGMYKPSDSLEFANLPTPSASNLGFVYIVTNAFTSDSRFTDYDSQTQTGHDYPADSEVMVIIRGTNENPVYMYNVIGGIMDGYETKSQQLTYAEYQALVQAGTVDPNKSYYVPDAPASEFDGALSDSSENAVQNKVVTAAIGENVISKSATGTSFTLSDAADGHLQNLKVKGATDSSAQSVGENGLTVQTSGKNIFNDNIENGTLSSTGSLVERTNRLRCTGFTKIKPNKTYNISVISGSTQKTIEISVQLWRTNTHGANIQEYDSLWKSSNSFTFTTTPYTNYLTFVLRYSDNADIAPSIISSVKLCETTSATLTTAAPYCSLSDALTDEVDMLAGVVHKKCYSVTFDGSSDENWTVYSDSHTSATGSKVFLATMNVPKYIVGSTTSSISNYLEPRSEPAMYSGNTENIYCFYISNFGVRISAIGTETDLRTYLAAHPLTIVYELATPYDAPLSSAEISALQGLETYKTTTNISITDAPSTTIDYLRDTDNGQAAADLQVNILAATKPWNNAGAHNAIYRGKYLGTSVTADQWAMIDAGTFDDLFIGDYWTIGSVNYRIAALDYYWGTGDTACNKHHAVIVPDTKLYSTTMNTSATTAGGYVGSKMYTTNIPTDVLPIVETAFGSTHILQRKEYLSNAIANEMPSGGAWYNIKLILMTEMNVLGGRILGPTSNGSNYNKDIPTDNRQFPLFMFAPISFAREDYWLRDIVNSERFAYINEYGIDAAAGANSQLAVRPSFSIYAG